jgi:predicted MFS family arabinose efflux permease
MVGYYLSAIFIGLGNGHVYPAFLNMFISIANHNERGTANSSILTSWDAGQGIGVLIGGIIAEHTGYVSMFWTVVGINLIGVLMFFTVTRQFYERKKIRE